MAKKTEQNDISAMSFEQTISELTGIVEMIEQGDIALQESLDKYERGMLLIKHCREILGKAEKKIEAISASEEEADVEDDESEDVLF